MLKRYYDSLTLSCIDKDRQIYRRTRLFGPGSFKGRYENGQFVGVCVKTEAFGSTITGPTINGKLHGICVYRDIICKIEGNYENGHFVGPCIKTNGKPEAGWTFQVVYDKTGYMTHCESR